VKFLFVLAIALVTPFAASQTSLDINPGLKQVAPVPSDCPANSHWTTQGSGVAHCVMNDPACPSGTELTHDSLGNPSCFVLIKETEERESSCASGEVGSRLQERTKTIHANGSATYSAWKTVSDNCTASAPTSPPPSSPSGGGDGTPNCPNGASDYPACTPPQSPSPSCPNGASDYPACSPPAPPQGPITCPSQKTVKMGLYPSP